MPDHFAADRWQVLSHHLDEALDLTAEERLAWLEALRAEDTTLAADVEALLARDELLSRAGYLEGRAAPPPLEGSLAGQAVGAYTLRCPIGQGGMGSVWLADRSDGRFEGAAAVKLLNASLVGRDGEARFRREGSILARLRHPHIAQLIDAGVSPLGHPFLVLEHVDGQRIDHYCDERRLGIEGRIGLFLDVLEAVAHAHANLIVHRDIKPSNVLVTRDGQVKLLDFGIAKLLERDDATAESTALTRDGEAVLTPEYAAPEQVTGGQVTTATDVYALGVLLYLLLTGRHPGAESRASPADLIRSILETAAPRLSDALSRPGTPNALLDIASLRTTSPARLRAALSGDLDNVVARALRKAPAERYASTEALADDLRRYLTNRPVKARPDSLPYRAAKFVRRNRTAVAAAAVAFGLLAGAVVRERTLRARAEAEAHKAKAVEQYLGSVFAAADPFAPPDVKGSDVTARALLERGAARVESLTDEPDVQAELRGVLGDVYASLGLYDKAAPLLQRSLEYRRSVHGPRHPAVAEAMDRLGTVLANQDRFDEGEQLLRDALAQRRALLGNTDPATAATIDHLAGLLTQRSDFAAAEPLFREALAAQRALHGSDHEDVALALNSLGVLLYLRGRYDEAEPLYRQALAIRSARLGENHPLTAETLQNLGQTQQYRGRFDEAEALYRRALAAERKTLGNAHPNVTLCLNNLGKMLLREKGQVQEAESLIREALALDQQMFGRRHQYVAESLTNLGLVLQAKGEFDEAVGMLREALAVKRSLHGADHTTIALGLNNLARALYLKGELAGAIPLLRQAKAMYERLVGPEHSSAVAVTINLARALREFGDRAEAETLFRASIGRLDASSPGDRAHLIAAELGLGQTLSDQHRAADALPLLERALEMSRERFGNDNWHTGEALLGLGLCLAGSGQHARAEPMLRQANELLQSQRRAQPRLVRQAAQAVARTKRARHTAPAA